MNSAQQDEIQRFLGEQVKIRQQLRAVRHELDQDIDQPRHDAQGDQHRS